jgi:rubrerythrin
VSQQVRTCEACGSPFIPEKNELLCPICNATIDEETDLLLEQQHFDEK